jgi:hypothetical protein
VQPGGAAALQCLENNMARLSSGCQAAVKAVAPAAEAKPAAPAAAAASKPAVDTKPAAEASKSAATKSTAAKSATTTSAADAVSSTTGAAVATPAAAPAAAPMLVLRPLRPLEELRIVNAACGADARAFCGAVEPGGGRVARCLAMNAPSLSPACRSMLARFAAR